MLGGVGGHLEHGVAEALPERGDELGLVGARLGVGVLVEQPLGLAR